VAAMLLAPAAWACDAALEATVAAKPADTDTRDALARSCARAGAQAEALAQYDALLAVDAANVDWLLGKAQALLALGRPREALPFLEDARRRAPDYEDVWRANANALDRLDEFDAADALLTDAAAQFPQAAWPRERQAALRERRLLDRGARLSADLSYEELSGDRPAWKGASLALNYRLGEKRHAFAGLHLEERFDARDEQLLFGYAATLGDDWSYGISGDIAPDAEVLPEWSITAEAGRPLSRAWGIGFRLRHASYAAVDVDTVSGSVDKYRGAYSAGYSLNAAKTSDIDDPSFGHLLRLAREYGESSRAALVVGFGEEAETVAPGVVQVTETKSIALAGLHWTSTAWGFAWEAGWYEQGDLYDRFRIRVGLEHRF
ncbi:MAG TPA: YaiO family outer membrane beta-barrel protein, partial [Steroidobacteraceae bacterium]|nr:YaiO family outer membrane beta-barrel protein [Steroidobacteraceae bacterium]